MVAGAAPEEEEEAEAVMLGEDIFRGSGGFASLLRW